MTQPPDPPAAPYPPPTYQEPSYQPAPYPPPGYPPAGAPGYPQQVQPGYPQPVQPGYPQQVQPGYPQQVQPGYPQPGQPSGYPQPVQPGYPQPGQPSGYPQAVQPGYPQPGQPSAYAQPGQPAAYPVPGYPPPGYPPQGYAQPGYQPPGYPPAQAQSGYPLQPGYPSQPYPLPVAPTDALVCRICGASPAVAGNARAHRGMVVIMQYRKLSGPFCRDCGIAAVRRLSSDTLWQGWWGYISFFVTPVVLVLNLILRVRLAGLPEPVRAPGSNPPMDPGKPLYLRPPALIAGVVFVALIVLFIVAIIAAATGSG